MSAHPNKGEPTRAANFNKSAFHHSPKPEAPKQSDSWWARPAVQKSRAEFNTAFKCEAARIIGDERFGGSKPIISLGLTDKLIEFRSRRTYSAPAES